MGNIRKLIQACELLSLPIIWLEQYPEGLGPTVPELADLLPDQQPLVKNTFNACGEAAFVDALAAHQRRQWLLCGIEAHVCVYQTALGMLAAGYEVELVADAVASRRQSDITVALQKLQTKGAALTTVEMCLFELVGDAANEHFKKLLPIIR